MTIVTAAYNAERFLSATIDSVRAQTFGDFEYIIIDDGSRDGTADVVRRHMDEEPRVRLVQQSNRGLAATRNAGIRAARGELIAFLDHDDFWRPEKLALQIAALDANPKADVASCYSAVIGSDGAQLGWQFGGNANGDVYWEMLEWDMVSGGSVPLCRRAAFDRVGFFDESLPCARTGTCGSASRGTADTSRRSAYWSGTCAARQALRGSTSVSRRPDNRCSLKRRARIPLLPPLSALLPCP